MTGTAAAQCALLETDRRGVITYGNDAVPLVTGFQPADLVGRHLSRLGGRAARAQVGRCLARAATGGADRVEVWQVRKDGSGFRAGWVVVARPGAGPGRDGFSVVIHELAPTGRRRHRRGSPAATGPRPGTGWRAPAREEVAAAERHRLARDLHDSISPVLYSIGLGSRTARQLLDQAPQQAHEPIDRILRLTETGLAELRALIFGLRPQALAEEGLVAALATQAAALRTGYGVATRLLLDPEPAAAVEVKVVLYLAAQEAMQNIARHARARTVTVRLRDGPTHLVLEIIDDGVGFDPAQPFPGQLGLVSMRERVEEVGGVLEVSSAPGRGTRVRARTPPRPVSG